MAAFVAYNANLDKFGIVSAGLRYEHVGFDYTDNLDAENNMTRYQDEFFPNITWSKQFGAIQTSLSYTMKTVRPKYSSLNDHIYSYLLSELLYPVAGRLETQECHYAGGEHQCPLEVD